ncbi:MAG TPA: hypothetical protein VMD58_00455 [Acidobacteriaceae bacterium]|nr:hypothetical protein [Acidobacteriaceae bacterium]
MKTRSFRWTLPIFALLILAVAFSAWAQTPVPVTFHGTINDYTPATPVGGPWEVRGQWSLTLKGKSGKADFSAALNMERSDEGVLLSGGSDFNNPVDRNAHTHHITLVNGAVTLIPHGFQVTGPATITANGVFPPPFGSTLPVLTIQVVGATGKGSVPFSNITVLFGAPASVHFGTNPLHGVVRGIE